MELYLAAFYPAMPITAREDILHRLRLKPMTGGLPELAGILVSNHVRHCFTEYESLLDAPENVDRCGGLKRDEARVAVAREHNRVLHKWRRGAPTGNPILAAIRRKYRVERKKLKSLAENERVAIEPDLVAREDTEIAEFCRRWLLGHFATISDLP